MKKVVCLVFILLSGFDLLWAQCEQPSFTLPAAVCFDENISLINTKASGYNFEWDFCAGDLKFDPTGSDLLNNANFFRARSIRFVQEAGMWYAFTISSTANILMRLDFGLSLASTPTFTNLGNVGGVLSGAFGFDIIKENGIYYIIVANGSGSNIIRYSFTNGIASQPQTDIVNTSTVFSSAGPNLVRIVTEGNEKIGFVSVGTSVATTQVVRLDFGTSITNNSPSIAQFSISGANQLRGLSFVKACDQWFGFGVAVSSNALYRMSFGSDLKSVPTVITLNT
jgi:hypothetical protein